MPRRLFSKVRGVVVIEKGLPQQRLRFRVPALYRLVAIELLLALLAGFGLTALGADGASWILGGVMAGAFVFYVYRSRYSPQAEPNRTSRKIGQVLVGLTVGFAISNSHLANLSTQLPIFILLTFFLLLSGCAIGYLYSRLSKTDLLTAMLATTPGNIGVMASIAADYGKQIPLVSLVQLMRFTAVTFIIPILVHAFTPVSGQHDLQATLTAISQDAFIFHPFYLLWLCLLSAVTIAAIQVGTQWRIPVATFLCPIGVGLVFNGLLNLVPFLPPMQFSLPIGVNLMGQILLGLTIGEYWGMNPKLQKSAVAHATVPVILTFVVGVAAAGIAMLITPWDWLTCLLVTAPGGSPEMIWIALALHHNVEVVTVGHIVRLLAINLCLPLLVAFASSWDNPPRQHDSSLVVDRRI